jgi:hypothetical protein
MLERTRGDLTNALEMAKVKRLLQQAETGGKRDQPE